MAERKRIWRWVRWLATLISIPLLYALSYPPVIRWYAGPDVEPWFKQPQFDTSELPFYRPLEYALDKMPWAYRPMMWWAHVWDVDAAVFSGMLSRVDWSTDWMEEEDQPPDE